MRGLLSVLLLVVTGCYSYVAVGGTAPVEGADVELQLTAPRDVALQDVTVHGITGVQGRLLSADSDSVALAVVRLWGLEGRSYEATGVGVRLPRADIATVREKRMSGARSALAIGASSAGIVAMVLGVKGLLGSGGGSGRPPPLP
jgi:hypothetical protein